MTTLVVVYDSGCGGCSAIAARLPDILVPTTLVRSCRDPRLRVEYPALAGHLGERPCRRPLLVIAGEHGAAEVVGGPRMLMRAARFVVPGRRWAAIRLAATITWQRSPLSRRGSPNISGNFPEVDLRAPGISSGWRRVVGRRGERDGRAT